MGRRAVMVVLAAILLALAVDSILGYAQSIVREAAAARMPAIQPYGEAEKARAPPKITKPAATTTSAAVAGEAPEMALSPGMSFRRAREELIPLAVDLSLALIIAATALAALKRFRG
ncbi:MAG TPA: hypothetical protein ENG52_01625 [Nitrososphaeria archaeon]|nr:hypothetical protein [Nitrososphaeria archaeon]